MKKIKVLFMVTVLAIMLCSCSFLGDAEITEADLASMTDEELESLIEERLEELDAQEGQGNGESEEAQVSETVRPIEETFECLPEMLEADWDDCLIQIDKTILRDDCTMTLNEVITALQNSGVEYSFKLDLNSTDYNADTTLVMGKDTISIWVLKGDDIYFVIGAKNTSDETIKASDAAVIFDYIQTFEKYPEVYRNMYYCHGLRADGGNETYESMKEIFAEHADNMRELNTRCINRQTGENVDVILISITSRFEPENESGETISCNFIYCINSADSSCVAVDMSTDIPAY